MNINQYSSVITRFRLYRKSFQQLTTKQQQKQKKKRDLSLLQLTRQTLGLPCFSVRVYVVSPFGETVAPYPGYSFLENSLLRLFNLTNFSSSAFKFFEMKFYKCSDLLRIKIKTSKKKNFFFCIFYYGTFLLSLIWTDKNF